MILETLASFHTAEHVPRGYRPDRRPKSLQYKKLGGRVLGEKIVAQRMSLIIDVPQRMATQ
ncbi:MAG TPA: hypothetical protein VEG65_04510 [Candidatus Bathyarchaeia archaeon]|nr:hypothetical protein [Candidatus Bathyarchaeia archaeon]